MSQRAGTIVNRVASAHWLAPLIGAALLAVGCSSELPFPLATVEGTVAYQGKPIERGRVVFYPTAGTPGPTAVGMIEPDGTFRIQTLGRDGAAIGRHRITVHFCEVPPAEQATASDGFVPRSLIPEKYTNPNTSGLWFEVQAGENVAPIELTGPR